MARVSTPMPLWTLFCKIIRITMARIDRLSPPRSGTCLGKHGILEIMMKTDGIVTERRKFNDQGNRVITHTRVHALPRPGWSFINHRGHRVKPASREALENGVNRHPEVHAAPGRGSWAPKICPNWGPRTAGSVLRPSTGAEVAHVLARPEHHGGA
jgi:hypothetical protein